MKSSFNSIFLFSFIGPWLVTASIKTIHFFQSKIGSSLAFNHVDTVISDLFDEDAAELYCILSLSDLEIIYVFEIPEDLYDRTDLTLGEYAYELSQLPVISDELYPEFYDIKFTSMKLTIRYIELETKTDEESLREMQRINEKFNELTDRLNVLLGNILVN